MDLHKISSARRGDLVGDAGVGVAHWSRSGRLSRVKVCSQQEEGETMLSGESHPEHFPEQEKGPQTALEASRKHSDQKGKSGLCGSKYPSISISPADLIPSVSEEHLKCPLSSCSQKLFGRLTVERKDC